LQGQLQQGSLQGGGIKRTLELDTVSNNKPQNIQMEEISILFDKFDYFPMDIKREILKIVSISNLKEVDNVELLKLGNPLKLIKLVCTGWENIVEGDKPLDFANEVIRSAYSLTNDEFNVYQRLVKGKLLYKPKKKSDVGMIELPTSQLWNPLEGTFDLSQCEDAGKYLNISTGYRKEIKAENANKFEVWLAPRFLVGKELTTTAGHLQDIYGNWNESASVGIFWTVGPWDLADYTYETTQTLEQLSKSNFSDLMYGESVLSKDQSFVDFHFGWDDQWAWKFDYFTFIL
jgi:hypothetical protein